MFDRQRARGLRHLELLRGAPAGATLGASVARRPGGVGLPGPRGPLDARGACAEAGAVCAGETRGAPTRQGKEAMRGFL